MRRAVFLPGQNTCLVTSLVCVLDVKTFMFGMLQVGSRWIWKFLAYQHPCMGYILTGSAAKHCSDVILELRLSVSQSVSAMVAS